LDLLITSPAWHAIKWSDAHWNVGGGGFSYELDPQEVVEFLRRQTRANKPVQSNAVCAPRISGAVTAILPSLPRV